MESHVAALASYPTLPAPMTPAPHFDEEPRPPPEPPPVQDISDESSVLAPLVNTHHPITEAPLETETPTDVEMDELDPQIVTAYMWNLGAQVATVRAQRRCSPERSTFGRQAIHDGLLASPATLRLPRGCLYRLFHQPTASSVRDFPCCNAKEVAHLSGERDLDADDAITRDMDEFVDDDASLDNTDASDSVECDGDNVIHVAYRPRAIGLQEDGYKVYRLVEKLSKKLADSGANICLTNDLSLLLKVRTITPIPVGVAVDGDPDTAPQELSCSKLGYLPLPLLDGTYHLQPCYYHPNASDTIISPQAITSPDSIFHRWTQEGYADGRPGTLSFFGSDECTPLMTIPLDYHDGLYYFNADAYVPTSHSPLATRPAARKLDSTLEKQKIADRLIETELWSCRLGHLSDNQLMDLKGNVEGIPNTFQCHPFRNIDWKVAAEIRKQPAYRTSEQAPQRGQRFLMDFGFIRASTEDYRKRSPETDRVVESFDGYSSYLIIVDESSRYCWTFLCKSKQPPVELVSTFLKDNGLASGGVIRTDLGGELARSTNFVSTMLQDHNYKVEPTGADSPNQNGMAERLNGTLGALVRSLLYGAGLPAQFWSCALLHACYLYNRRVHTSIGCTPFQAFNGRKPNLRFLRTFGSRVAVRRPGKRRSKLDRHDYRGIFLGYTATDKNIRYLDLDSGTVKSSHHVVFDEAWYLHPSNRPPSAQHLFNLGYIDVDDFVDEPDHPPTYAPIPPPPKSTSPTPKLPMEAIRTHLPIGLSDPSIIAARAASIQASPCPPAPIVNNPPAKVLEEFNIGQRDIAQVYLSTTPFAESFEEEINLRYRGKPDHPTAGLSLHPGKVSERKMWKRQMKSPTLVTNLRN